MHFKLDFKEKMSKMKELEEENGTFWKNQNLFLLS